MLEAMFPLGWQHYLVGGVSIGVGVSLLFALTGVVAGMSTVFTSTWSYVSKRRFFAQQRFVESRAWRLALALGLVLGGALWWVSLGPSGGLRTSVPLWQLGAGGLLVGYGSRLSNGCTSGHGICGLSSLQAPSLVAVLTFMTTGFATAQLVRWLGGR